MHLSGKDVDDTLLLMTEGQPTGSVIKHELATIKCKGMFRDY